MNHVFVYIDVSYPTQSVLPGDDLSTTSKRSKFLYAWFCNMKNVFARYVFILYKLRILVHLWRFYIFRTSFIGLTATMDLSESEIKTRTRHSRNSSVFRDTYLYNTLHTTGKSSTIDRKMKLPVNFALFEDDSLVPVADSKAEKHFYLNHEDR